MNKTIRVLSLLAVATLVSMAANAGDTTLDVTGAAALDDNFGLEVIFANSTGNAYVGDETPADESTYNAEFKIRVHGDNFNIDVANDATSRHEIFVARNPSNLMRIEVHCRVATGGPGTGNCGNNNDGQWRAKAYARLDNNTWKFCGQTGFVPTGIATLSVEWGQGTGGADGFIRFYKGGDLIRECTGIDNDDRGVNTARIGATGRVDVGTSGTSHMDSFVSTR